MKKAFSLFAVLLLTGIFSLGYFNIAMAQAGNTSNSIQFWNNDKNYPIVFTQNGVNRYIDLSSAKIIEQVEDMEDGTLATVFSYDVVMVQDQNITRFSYKTVLKLTPNGYYIASVRGNGGDWAELTNRSFDQPQYNAAIMLGYFFNIIE